MKIALSPLLQPDSPHWFANLALRVVHRQLRGQLDLVELSDGVGDARTRPIQRGAAALEREVRQTRARLSEWLGVRPVPPETGLLGDEQRFAAAFLERNTGLLLRGIGGAEEDGWNAERFVSLSLQLLDGCLSTVVTGHLVALRKDLVHSLRLALAAGGCSEHAFCVSCHQHLGLAGTPSPGHLCRAHETPWVSELVPMIELMTRAETPAWLYGELSRRLEASDGSAWRRCAHWLADETSREELKLLPPGLEYAGNLVELARVVFLTALEQTLGAVVDPERIIEDEDVAEALTRHVVLGDSLVEAIAPFRSKRVDLALYRYSQALLSTVLAPAECAGPRRQLGEALAELAQTARCFSVHVGAPAIPRVRSAGLEGPILDGPLGADWTVQGARCAPGDLEVVDANGTGWSLLQWLENRRMLVLCSGCGRLPDTCPCATEDSPSTPVLVLDPGPFFAGRRDRQRQIRRHIDELAAIVAADQYGSPPTGRVVVAAAHSPRHWGNGAYSIADFREVVRTSFRVLERLWDTKRLPALSLTTNDRRGRAGRIKRFAELAAELRLDRLSGPRPFTQFPPQNAAAGSLEVPDIDDWIDAQNTVAQAVKASRGVVLCGTEPALVTFALDLVCQSACLRSNDLESGGGWPRLIMAVGELSEAAILTVVRDERSSGCP